MSSNDTKLPIYKVFLCASGSSMVAEAITLPIDITKIRLQLQGEIHGTSGAIGEKKGMIKTGLGIIKNEGFFSLYAGLSAALLRQFVYTGLRVGSYDAVRNKLKNDGPPPLWQKIMVGAGTGMFASSVATPTDLVKVRMQAQGLLPKGTPRPYKNLLHSFYSIATQEGVKGLWRGVGPTMLRAVCINAGELATYDQSKQLLISHRICDDTPYAHFGASLMAGLVATVLANPFDVVKTRMMNQRKHQTQVLYKHAFDCMYKTAVNEGPLALYKGFVPNYVRIGPWCIVFFLVFEKFKQVARRM